MCIDNHLLTNSNCERCVFKQYVPCEHDEFIVSESLNYCQIKAYLLFSVHLVAAVQYLSQREAVGHFVMISLLLIL